MYGVLGGVLLFAGLALRSYLNQEPNVNRFKQPFVIPPIVAAEGNVETSSGAADPEISTDDVFDARVLEILCVWSCLLECELTCHS